MTKTDQQIERICWTVYPVRTDIGKRAALGRELDALVDRARAEMLLAMHRDLEQVERCLK